MQGRPRNVGLTPGSAACRRSWPAGRHPADLAAKTQGCVVRLSNRTTILRPLFLPCVFAAQATAMCLMGPNPRVLTARRHADRANSAAIGAGDRKSGVQGKRVEVRVDLGVRRNM